MPQATETHVITTGNVDIIVDEESGSSTMGAYMARPQAPGSYPGVIVGFELFGVTSYIRTIVDRIAQLGYVALAPDFYHRSFPGIELEATAEGRARGQDIPRRVELDALMPGKTAPFLGQHQRKLYITRTLLAIGLQVHF